MIRYEPIIHTVKYNDVTIDVLRLDLIHRRYGGNKFFKLKYNVQKAKVLGLKVLTFGGAHSNHLYSSAAMCKLYNLNLICVIRGEDSELSNSPTLQFARECGAILHFVSREKYKHKSDDDMIAELKDKFGDFYLIPEGGGNFEGVKGCTEILTPKLKSYGYVLCACGTGTTFAGIKISSGVHEKVLGISVLKGENTLLDATNKWLSEFGSHNIEPYEKGQITRSTILDSYHFGGYAKHTQELLDFKKDFETSTTIPLDYVYTSKLFFAAFDLIKSKKIAPDSKVLVIHSGGLQGNPGYEKRYGIV
jgi:1-aminocyclopropane-1-carboxylate deaminase